MLVEFSVGNFRSFREQVALSMLAASLRAVDKTVDANNVAEVGRLRILRSAAIYGANASGKSNLIQAMRFMRTFVLRSSSSSQVGDPIGVEPFRLRTTTQDEPSYFQIIFTLGGKRYRYGFELDRQRVRTEWLYHTAQRESRLFAREEDVFDISGVFREGRGLEERTRDNALFLSVVAQFNGELATAILSWFRMGFNVISGLDDAAYGSFTLTRFERDAAFRQRVLAFMREADLGISDISIVHHPFAESKVPEELRNAFEEIAKSLVRHMGTEHDNDQGGLQVSRVTTTHRVFDKDGGLSAEFAVFDMDEQESQGTQKFFHLSGPILDTLEKGKVLVIDEMEARLHPFLTRAIIELFHSPRTNPRNAQLVFATHDTGLLNSRLFRRDQIWFTEKDRFGSTDLYSLAELQVRNDASFSKDYVMGKYGAVPFIGGLPSLFEERPDVEEA